MLNPKYTQRRLTPRHCSKNPNIAITSGRNAYFQGRAISTCPEYADADSARNWKLGWLQARREREGLDS